MNINDKNLFIYVNINGITIDTYILERLFRFLWNNRIYIVRIFLAQSYIYNICTHFFLYWVTFVTRIGTYISFIGKNGMCTLTSTKPRKYQENTNIFLANSFKEFLTAGSKISLEYLCEFRKHFTFKFQTSYFTFV